MTENYWLTIILSFLLGAPSGFSPGPMLFLIISETLRHGIRAGAKVAFIPLITDVPILLITGFFFSELEKFKNLIGFISLTGSIFLLYIGIKSFRLTNSKNQADSARKFQFKELIIANFLNPNPYLFWFTVGSPLLVSSFNNSLISGISFLIGFYFGLVGSKLFLALITSTSKNFLKDIWYKLIMQFLGLTLIGISIKIFIDSLDLLNIF